MAWCDNTFESLALTLRTSSAGSNTVSDHIEVLQEAIIQIPAAYRRDLLITVDGAGASHGLIEHITTLDTQGQPRELAEAGVVELTALLCLEGPLAKTLRYRLLRTAARIICGGRKRTIRIPKTWPWAQQLATCLRTALALPPPTPC